MSILIKGMGMPKCCVECEWHEYYGGDYDWVHACRRTGTMPIGNADTERANDCSLVEIPEPHGDLIDREVLKAHIDSECVRRRIFTGITIAEAMKQIADEVPVVIERSEE